LTRDTPTVLLIHARTWIPKYTTDGDIIDQGHAHSSPNSCQNMNLKIHYCWCWATIMNSLTLKVQLVMPPPGIMFRKDVGV